jgi:hypothetical protein
VWEINVSRTGDPVHAGDKALTREIPTQRGRVNRYESLPATSMTKAQLTSWALYSVVKYQPSILQTQIITNNIVFHRSSH